MVTEVTEGGRHFFLSVTRLGIGLLKTRWGQFWQFDLHVSDEWLDYTAIVSATWEGEFRPSFRRDEVLVRVDSGCSTGQVCGDETCECRAQFEGALAKIADAGEGVVVHIPRQDGRGQGTPFKLATLTLQEELGVDNVKAATLLSNGESIDIRTYGGAVAILRFLGVNPPRRLLLMTNNPHKIGVLRENGFICERLPLVIPATKETIRHLRAKQEKLGHLDLVPDKVSAL
jgi:GTP cyclohydrolase II